MENLHVLAGSSDYTNFGKALAQSDGMWVPTSPDLQNANQHLDLKSVGLDVNRRAEVYMLQNAVAESPSFAQFTAPSVEMEETVDPRLLSALRFIEKNYSRPSLGLKDIGQAAGISIWHLSRIFNAKMKMGFREYLKSVRLRHACTLLNSSSLEIKAIAAVVGYTHLSDFYHHFKSECGVSPRVFRHSMRRASLHGNVVAEAKDQQLCPQLRSA
jgi:AraC-like DNA-binding protein